MAQSYEDLTVYQKSVDLAVELHKISLSFPKIEQYVLADQLRRASKSICANLAEGWARKVTSVPEFRRFLSMAFGSAEEMRVWINFAHKLDYISNDAANHYQKQYIEVSKMLYALLKSWSQK